MQLPFRWGNSICSSPRTSPTSSSFLAKLCLKLDQTATTASRNGGEFLRRRPRALSSPVFLQRFSEYIRRSWIHCDRLLQHCVSSQHLAADNHRQAFLI